MFSKMFTIYQLYLASFPSTTIAAPGHLSENWQHSYYQKTKLPMSLNSHSLFHEFLTVLWIWQLYIPSSLVPWQHTFSFKAGRTISGAEEVLFVTSRSQNISASALVSTPVQHHVFQNASLRTNKDNGCEVTLKF